MNETKSSLLKAHMTWVIAAFVFGMALMALLVWGRSTQHLSPLFSSAYSSVSTVRPISNQQLAVAPSSNFPNTITTPGQDMTVGRFNFAATSATADVWISRITFISDTPLAGAALQNFRLYDSGIQIGIVGSWQNKLPNGTYQTDLVFTIPYVIAAGTVRTFDLRAFILPTAPLGNFRVGISAVGFSGTVVSALPVYSPYIVITR